MEINTAEEGLLPGHPHLRRLKTAMLAAAVATFSLLYFTQSLLPAIGADFDAGPTLTGLTVSAATGGIAVAIIPLSSLADSHGRVRVMRWGLVAACLLGLLCAAAPALWMLLVLRLLVGVALAGVVAVAVGHLGDEVHPTATGSAIGLYVSGNTLGGVVGRLVPGAALRLGSWRIAVLLVVVCAAVAVVVFTVQLPPARRFRPAPATFAAHSRSLACLWSDPGIRRLCLLAFVLMGGFVACYNYLTFRLTAVPVGLSDTAVSLLFLAYLAGTFSSPIGARWAQRVGRRAVICASAALAVCGLALTLTDRLLWITIGLVMFTAGFFSAHSVASGWVAARAGGHRGQAAGLYLTAYYLGSCVLGALAGLVFEDAGWTGCAIAIAVLFVLGIVSVATIRTSAADTEGTAVGAPGVTPDGAVDEDRRFPGNQTSAPATDVT
jgi:YNFM family putative membrane transporter